MAHLARIRVHRSLVATLLCTALLLAVTACGMNAQTLQPYTPAEGVNANVGSAGEWVQVRNLMILSRVDGTGYLSASIIAQEPDAMTAVSGHPIRNDSTPGGAPFTVTMAGPVDLPAEKLVVLTERDPITLTSPDLIVGGAAGAGFSFRNAGDLTIEVPVMDGNDPAYTSVIPSPTPSS